MQKFKRITSILTVLSFIALASPFQGKAVYAAEKNRSSVNMVSSKNNNDVPSKKSNYGVKAPTKEEKAWMDKNMIKTTKVDLNSLAHQRKSNEKNKASELRTDRINSLSKSAANENATSELPSSADNSTLKYFPTIGNQGSLGTCASFATTYYQMSYTLNFDRNKDAKNDPNNLNKYSPKWTYNFVNGINNNGSSISGNYRIMQENGVPSLADYPYSPDTVPETNYRAWPTNASIYKTAMKNRIDESGYVTIGDNSTKTPITSPSDSHLNEVKSLLANGKVLTFTTYIFSWNTSDYVVKDDPSTTLDDDYVGQSICAWENRTQDGGHAMTVVGYNDNIWVDLNKDGKVEPGEKGAFKIANSWGTDWGNKGFMWISYDALNEVSSVNNNPSGTSRMPVFDSNTLYWISVKPSTYTPKVMAQFTLNTSKRDQIITKFNLDGNKDTDINFRPGILLINGGDFSFDGTANACDSSFVIDLTSLLDKADKKDFLSHKWGVEISDTSKDGSPLTIKDFKIIDNSTSNEYTAPISMPTILDGNMTKFCVNSVNIAAPTNLHSDSQTLTSIHLSWTPSSTSSVVGYDIYESGQKMWTSTKPEFTVDNLTPGESHDFSVLAYDADGNYSILSNSIEVSTLQDNIPPTTPTNLICTSKSSKSVSLSWSPSTDNYKVRYHVYRLGKTHLYTIPALVADTTDTKTTDESVNSNSEYTYYVEAYDGYNCSQSSNNLNVTTDASKSTIYYKSAAGRNNIHYCIDGTWTAVPGKLMSDSTYSGYKEYTIDLGSDNSAKVCFNLNGGNWDNNNSNNYTVGEGNWTIDGDTHTMTQDVPQIKDSITAPSNLTATNTTDSSVTLTWNESKVIGSKYVAGYGIYRDDKLIGLSIGATSYTDTNISPKNTKYNYYVRALDSMNNPISDKSNTITVGGEVGNVVTIYYKQGYSTPYIHYCVDGGSWTSVPGVKIPTSDIAGYNKITIDLGMAAKLQACFNDGNGKWDNNQGKNYTFQAGTYTFVPGSNGASGTITKGGPVNQGISKFISMLGDNIFSSIKAA
ncbi:carbohydrate binding domain-containing protein [Inconstantimicrobium mannanitabidum]|uniref:Uncharacterized protein n=1 Tax=Inconstantimicrobium mannanitabidum TaxID=1604901 RepID=A0ACB5R753_9CLOT|nr:carbohydrate binding domain-containing protein [Clostridium sp. TW13]GKX64987.1 hypothetical protein rsdtw13_02450 [Clostridium sp. TW13]